MEKRTGVPLLPASTRTLSTELLGLHPTRVRDQESPVVRNQLLPQLERARRIDVFGEVCNNGLGDGLTDGVYPRNVSTTVDAHSNVDACELLLTDDENGFVDL